MKKPQPISSALLSASLCGAAGIARVEVSSLFPQDKDAPAPMAQDVAQIHQLAHHLLMSQEMERSRLSLELHDHITQLVCATILHCQKLAGQLESSPQAQADAYRLGELMGTVAEEVERISRTLRPGVLETLGLNAAMRASQREFIERTGIALSSSLPALTISLSAEAELALYRILQEALRNIEQHAAASHVTIQLVQSPREIQLLIEDDGVGFTPALPRVKAGARPGLGIVGMRERASCVGGSLQVLSAPDKGTLVRAQIPLIPIGTPAPYA